jgi:hypothetical protein
MQTASDYLARTESAVQRLFAGVESYMSILKQATGLTFVTGEPYGPAQDAEFAAWQRENAERLVAAKQAEQEFIAESFALSTLCGAVLQVAGKAIEIYGENTVAPAELATAIKGNLTKFCIGRRVRTVHLGLVIYAARNQHTHFNDGELREPSRLVFRLLATGHGYGSGQEIVDPAFDLRNERVLSFASNVTSLIGWRSYENYVVDMRALLGT